MNLPINFNLAIGSCLVIILIAIDYFRKFNMDNYQRKLLFSVLCAIFITIILDLVSHILKGIPGHAVNIILYCSISLYLIAGNCSFYLSAVFFDYFAHGNIARTNKLIRAVGVLLLFYAASVIFNLSFGFYFFIDSGNNLVYGQQFILQVLFSFIPLIIIIINVNLAPKQFRQTRGSLVAIFIIISLSGVILDIIFKQTSLVWSGITAAFLFIYLFIIKSHLKVDTLTGIGNRYSFDEFVKRISKQNTTEDYSIAIIDLDHFKEINNVLGYHEGDNALRDMAAIIKSTVRQSDIAARLENDEFVLVTSIKDNIQRMIDRIEEAIEKQNTLRIRPYQLFMSYGYDIYTTNSGRSIHEFLNRIDRIMYKYKESRHNQIATVITAKLDNTTAKAE
jgi:diguanylate cyclase (GGDEF)-like protein